MFNVHIALKRIVLENDLTAKWLFARDSNGDDEHRRAKKNQQQQRIKNKFESFKNSNVKFSARLSNIQQTFLNEKRASFTPSDGSDDISAKNVNQFVCNACDRSACIQYGWMMSSTSANQPNNHLFKHFI